MILYFIIFIKRKIQDKTRLPASRSSSIGPEGCFSFVHPKGRHQKKNVIKSENGTIGGRGSEKLLNFHHLQMMKNMEGGVSEFHFITS